MHGCQPEDGIKAKTAAVTVQSIQQKGYCIENTCIVATVTAVSK